MYADVAERWRIVAKSRVRISPMLRCKAVPFASRRRILRIACPAPPSPSCTRPEISNAPIRRDC